jgi:two-component system nitrate/nitrite response regulator NarL
MTKTTTHKKQPTAPTNRPRVVIADDDPLVRSMLPAQLEQEFECVGAGVNADEAVALVTLHRPDVVILDVDMPNGGAMYATREIRTASPETAIAILSGDETRSGVIALLEVGAISYLRKGVEPEDLNHHLKAAISAHRHATERHAA